jgi:Xaa-Pro aminopeptidase
VVTLSEAALWTDGRYYLQATNQLDASCWKLMKQGLPETPSIADWLNTVLPPNSRVGVDPRLMSKGQAKTIQTPLQTKGHQLVSVMTNLVDAIWPDRPASPDDKIFVHPLKYAGVSHSDKIKNIRNELQRVDAYGLVVSALDEVACTFGKHV